MPQTPNKGYVFETNPTDVPGHSLHGGIDGSGLILAEQLDADVVQVETDIGGVQDDIAALEAFTSTPYLSYTPVWGNTGGATFSTLVGRWKRIAASTVHWRAYAVVDNPGSGTDNLTITSPSIPDRSEGSRQVVAMHIERTGFAGDNILMGHVVSFAGGFGAVWDRIRWQQETDGTLENMQGQDLVNDMIITIQGVYEESSS